MAKKDTEEEELDTELDEDGDLDEEEEEDDEDDDLDDEDDEDEDLDDEDEEEDEDEDPLGGADFADEPLGQKDPFWWTPHLVLLLLLLVGMLGFFGLFNPWLGHLAPSHDEAQGSEQPEGHSSAAPAQPAPAGPAPSQTAAPTPANTVAQRPADETIYGARHILVQFEGVRGQKPAVKRTRAEAVERAEKVAAEAKKTTSIKNERERVKAFTALVDKYSDEPNAPKTRGDLGRFRDNAYEAKMVAGVKKLRVGDVSEPVESPFGFHILWRTL